MYATDSKSIRIAIVGAIAAGLLQAAHALGLGPITVNSHIGEPLRATINVTGLDAGQSAGTTVSIADNSAYQSRGIKKLPSHDQLNPSLQSTANGHYISISTPNVVREPFITFLLSIKSGGQETLREYTVFLDPATDGITIPEAPEQTVQKPAVAVNNTTAPVKTRLLVDQPATPAASGWKGERAKPTAPAAPVAASTQTGTWQGGRSYGPVQQGETLFSIADKVRPSADYSIQTVMRQIYRANPRAFSGRQLGSLMAGYTLTIPDFTKDMVAMPSRSTRASAAAKAPVATSSVTENTADDVQEVNETDNVALLNDTATDTEDFSDADTVADVDNEQAVGSVDEVDSSTLTDTDTNVQLENPIDSTTTTDIALNQPQYNSGISVVNAPSGNESIDLSVANNQNTGEIVSVQESTGNQNTSTPTVVAATSPDTSNVDLVVEESPVIAEDKPQNFMKTTYAFLPMWQWLLIGLGLLGLIAFLLFKQRKKHAVDEFDTLDDAEMNAVLAKINALENDENQVSNLGTEADWPHDSVSDYGAELESQYDQPHQDSENIFDDFADDLEQEHQSHGLSDFESDPDMFFNDEEMQELGQEPSAIEDIDGLEDDDFFIEDDAKTQNDDVVDFDLDDAVADSHIGAATASSEHSFTADDDMDDFFITEEDDEDIIPVLDEKPASDITWTDKSWADQEDFDLDELLTDDGEVSNKGVEIDSNAANTLDSDDEIDALIGGGTANNAAKDYAGVNPEEMEINLDLADSFIATGHGERAVIWLEEVIEVGTEEQKARAKALMDKVRGA